MQLREAPLSVMEKLQHRVASGLNRLPSRLQVLLSRRPPIRRDGLTLHPELQLLLATRELIGGGIPVSKLTPAEARRRLRRESLVHAGPTIPVGSVRDLVLDLPGQPLRGRHYVPAKATEPPPLLVFFHGGGFVLGDLDTHDPACRIFCRDGGLQVLAVEYRLAPEAPFPAAVDDALAAFKWAVTHAQSLGADPTRIAVGGDSAGGNLAAAVSQLAVAEGGAVPALQLLIYPAIDRTEERASLELFSEGFFLSRAEVDWYNSQYAGRCDPKDPRLCPLRAENLSGLPPALVITAGFDPLRDEGEAYAEALRKAGVPTVLRRFESLIHGLINMVGVTRVCRDATIEIATLTRELLLSSATSQRSWSE